MWWSSSEHEQYSNMAGVNWFRKGQHRTRAPAQAELPTEVNAKLIRELHRFTDYKISNDNLWRLIHSVVHAHLCHQEATQPVVTPKSTERQLSAMLKLSDTDLATALENCDTNTLTAVNVAKNSLWLTSKAKWVASNDPDAIPGTEVLAPETIRHAVEIALTSHQAEAAKRGRKAKPYHLWLARNCYEVWLAHCHPRSPARLEFTRAVFVAAGIHLGDKGLERLLTKAAQKKRSN